MLPNTTTITKLLILRLKHQENAIFRFKLDVRVFIVVIKEGPENLITLIKSIKVFQFSPGLLSVGKVYRYSKLQKRAIFGKL